MYEFVLRCVLNDRAHRQLYLHYDSLTVLFLTSARFWDVSLWAEGLVRGKICANDVARLMVIKLIRCHPPGTSDFLTKLPGNLAGRCDVSHTRHTVGVMEAANAEPRCSDCVRMSCQCHLPVIDLVRCVWLHHYGVIGCHSISIEGP